MVFEYKSIFIEFSTLTNSYTAVRRRNEKRSRETRITENDDSD